MSSGYYGWCIKAWRVVENWVTGTGVFEEERDVLVLLDRTRPDMIAEVSNEYQYVFSGETLQSVASCSFEWLQRTFRGHHSNQLAETAYITANPNTDTVNGVGLLTDLVGVWRTDRDDEEETVPPRRVTDTAIQHAREATWDRLIVRYMQPHPPFLTDAQGSHGRVVHPTRDTDILTVPEVLLAGGIDLERGWELHVENLRIVLDEVDVLRENLEAERLVISSTHGQAFGEWKNLRPSPSRSDQRVAQGSVGNHRGNG